MRHLYERIKRLCSEEEGQSLAEYGTIVTLIAVGSLVVLTTMYQQIAAFFGTIVSTLEPVISRF